MKKLFVLLSLIAINCFASGADQLSSGSWEGYKQMGSTYQAFALTIEENGNGFYGFIPDIKKASPICFPLTKKSLGFRNGYFQQADSRNGLEFILIVGPSIESTMEVMSIMKYPEKNSSFSQTWSLIPVAEDQKNTILFNSCKKVLSGT